MRSPFESETGYPGKMKPEVYEMRGILAVFNMIAMKSAKIWSLPTKTAKEKIVRQTP